MIIEKYVVYIKVLPFFHPFLKCVPKLLPYAFWSNYFLLHRHWHCPPDPGEGEGVVGPDEAGVPARGEAGDVEEAGLLVQGVPGAHHCRQGTRCCHGFK